MYLGIVVLVAVALAGSEKLVEADEANGTYLTKMSSGLAIVASASKAAAEPSPVYCIYMYLISSSP